MDSPVAKMGAAALGGSSTVKVGAAALGGYLLGRTKKGKAAVSLALWLTGRNYRLRDVARNQGMKFLQSEEGQKLVTQLRGPALAASKQAMMALYEAQAGKLADGLQGRIGSLSEGASSTAEKGTGKVLGGKKKDEQEQADSDAQDQAQDRAEQGQDESDESEDQHAESARAEDEDESAPAEDEGDQAEDQAEDQADEQDDDEQDESDEADEQSDDADQSARAEDESDEESDDGEDSGNDRQPPRRRSAARGRRQPASSRSA